MLTNITEIIPNSHPTKQPNKDLDKIFSILFCGLIFRKSSIKRKIIKPAIKNSPSLNNIKENCDNMGKSGKMFAIEFKILSE
ncbi:hypothetical protein P9E34_14090 [Schinkia azotoformans]|uniref:hypothetical protein n=1 Tax=Schinkia azotoformans TaxID=1454 RepID=UPI002DBBDF96|nr:hypothetical protein [Schinkia azotoformans]MEC1725844.1 hypothetical protein [Schinkia azotoformans]